MWNSASHKFHNFWRRISLLRCQICDFLFKATAACSSFTYKFPTLWNILIWYLPTKFSRRCFYSHITKVSCMISYRLCSILGITKFSQNVMIKCGFLLLSDCVFLLLLKISWISALKWPKLNFPNFFPMQLLSRTK